MSHLTKVLTFIIGFSSLVTAQTVQEKKAGEAAEKLRKEAVVFLRETLGEVNGMRSLENRISFTAELAGLMWYHDEREARAMYAGVITDFRDLLMRYDSEMTGLGQAEDEDSGNAFGFFPGMDPTDRSRLLRKFGTAMSVRQQIVSSMAEHDPDLAFGFYYDSIAAVANPELLKQNEYRDSYFEHQLLTQLADKDPGKAAKHAARSLAAGVNYQHIELLKKIYAKDPEKGAEFGAAILGRIKDGKFDSSTFSILSSLIEFGDSTVADSRKPGGKSPVYSVAQIRELAEVLAQGILSRVTEAEAAEGLIYVSTVQKHLPGRAAQIRSKFRLANTPPSKYSVGVGNAAYTLKEEDVSFASNSNTNSAFEKQMRVRQEREKEERKLLEEIQGIGTKQLPKEERERIIAQSRKILMQSPGRNKKVVGLSMLASQVVAAGDKELAAELMRDAAKLVNPEPKTIQDFMLMWMLASGYASAEPDKAFPLLEETIGRANETLAAFVKVGEFIDVNEDFITDGEVQVGAFGGQMVRGLTRDLSIADKTIEVLAEADFAKTKGLTNRFDRAEIRVLAKMMVLRAVLRPDEVVKPEVDGLPIEN